MIASYLLDDSVDEEERYQARKKVKARINSLFNGAADNTMFGPDYIPEDFGPPLDAEMTGGDVNLLPPLPPETLPREDLRYDPFPMLGPPVG